eukprot:765563-Pelagomonas_calceolata.AAC.1
MEKNTGGDLGRWRHPAPKHGCEKKKKDVKTLFWLSHFLSLTVILLFCAPSGKKFVSVPYRMRHGVNVQAYQPVDDRGIVL